MACFVFAGFGLTYWQPMLIGSMAFPPIVHVHAFIFSSWMALLMVQSLLFNTRNISLHRSVGTFGIVIATRHADHQRRGHSAIRESHQGQPCARLLWPDVLVGDGRARISARCSAWLSGCVRKPEYHRRLILFATLPCFPGINRLYMVTFGLERIPFLAMYLTLDALAAAILIHDWRTMGKISKASMIGVAFLLLQQLLHWPIASSDAFTSFTHTLTDLARYR